MLPPHVKLSPLLPEDYLQQILSWVRVCVASNLLWGEKTIFHGKIFQVPKGLCFFIP